ncbi:GRAM domain-containing protein [Geobacillus sp. FSL W8-0466]|uniref:GRAM domain-containing protein n=1 Tax=Geobacillus TaxID=129337 RepID=UPI00066FF8C2|nr:GRAM domain-containing protein [Geobacillus stearothermophilus]KMY61991.1 hypothetical protein AA906_02825 [Geobacillus stearothermophilus]
MITKEQGLQAIQEYLTENEIVEHTAIAHYKYENSLAGLAGIGSTYGVPVQGILVSTNSRLLFYGEVIKSMPVFVDIKYTDINRIEEKKMNYGLLKSIPAIIVSHKETETFTTQGNPDEFSKLKSFFELVKKKVASQQN